MNTVLRAASCIPQLKLPFCPLEGDLTLFVLLPLISWAMFYACLGNKSMKQQPRNIMLGWKDSSPQVNCLSVAF